jgi:predicted small metal-binding protein
MVKQIACSDAGYDCDFEVRSEEESDLIEQFQHHVRATHDDDLPAAEVRDAWRTV